MRRRPGREACVAAAGKPEARDVSTCHAFHGEER
jgi:hypothetical protein